MLLSEASDRGTVCACKAASDIEMRLKVAFLSGEVGFVTDMVRAVITPVPGLIRLMANSAGA
ncbi:hypothetical protein C1891_01360 [Pseudomonas sp. GW456-12-1-14-TSB6]|nr:hypothetical protein C1891_01360 [Pseudomonas sp. GW456-12-1-14-TSB6]